VSSPGRCSTRLALPLSGSQPTSPCARRPARAQLSDCSLRRSASGNAGSGRVRGTGESACKRNQIASNHSFDVERNDDKDADVSDKILTLTC